MHSTKLSKNKSGLIATLVIPAVAVVSILNASQVYATPVKESSSHLPISTSPKVSLTDLRDMGLIIQQIQQQSINIYLEATRKPVNFSTNPKIKVRKFLTNANLNGKTKYLATRPEWLTFYVGTMEPIIHLFEVNAKLDDKEVDYILVPRSTKEDFTKLLKIYDTDVERMNKELTIIFENISTKNNNATIAKAAVNLFNISKDLEKSRIRAFKLLNRSKDSKDLVKVRSTVKKAN